MDVGVKADLVICERSEPKKVSYLTNLLIKKTKDDYKLKERFYKMVQCQCAGTSKQKGYRKFPPASVLVCGLRNEIYSKKYYSSLKLVRSKIIFVLS
jgi:hypothetical protein